MRAGGNVPSWLDAPPGEHDAWVNGASGPPVRVNFSRLCFTPPVLISSVGGSGRPPASATARLLFVPTMTLGISWVRPCPAEEVRRARELAERKKAKEDRRKARAAAAEAGVGAAAAPAAASGAAAAAKPPAPATAIAFLFPGQGSQAVGMLKASSEGGSFKLVPRVVLSMACSRAQQAVTAGPASEMFLPGHKIPKHYACLFPSIKFRQSA